LLAAKRRLVGNNIDPFEDQLRVDIADGKVKYLAIAQLEKIGGKDVQLYAIGDTNEIVEADEGEDFPF
jgi:hypothetical protein